MLSLTLEGLRPPRFSLRAGSLVAARRAFVLLDVLSPSWSDLNALSMEPSLTYVATNPELIWCIVFTTCSTQRVPMLVFLLLLFVQALILVLYRDIRHFTLKISKNSMNKIISIIKYKLLCTVQLVQIWLHFLPKFDSFTKAWKNSISSYKRKV